MRDAELIDWGVLDYEEALERQRNLVKLRQQGGCGDLIIVVEHPHVITLGRRREALANVVAPAGVPVVEIERGGDVTYHGPGQVVVYPIVQLEEDERDLHLFLRNLEEGIIKTLARYELRAGREEGKTGVWLDGRKLASMGIACRKWVTFHGLALNVNTDLSYFQRINPCGFESSVMTSVSAELAGKPVDIVRLKKLLSADVASCIGRVLSAAAAAS
jgi:lipoate-protein ligase B